MIYLLVTVHVIVCLFLIGVVLLQQGASPPTSPAHSAARGSQTAFGPRGAANLLTKLTTWGAITFMVLSLTLTILLARSNSSAHSVLSGTPTQQTTPKQK